MCSPNGLEASEIAPLSRPIKVTTLTKSAHCRSRIATARSVRSDCVMTTTTNTSTSPSLTGFSTFKRIRGSTQLQSRTPRQCFPTTVSSYLSSVPAGAGYYIQCVWSRQAFAPKTLVSSAPRVALGHLVLERVPGTHVRRRKLLLPSTLETNYIPRHRYAYGQEICEYTDLVAEK